MGRPETPPALPAFFAENRLFSVSRCDEKHKSPVEPPTFSRLLRLTLPIKPDNLRLPPASIWSDWLRFKFDTLLLSEALSLTFPFESSPPPPPLSTSSCLKSSLLLCCGNATERPKTVLRVPKIGATGGSEIERSTPAGATVCGIFNLLRPLTSRMLRRCRIEFENPDSSSTSATSSSIGSAAVAAPKLYGTVARFAWLILC